MFIVPAVYIFTEWAPSSYLKRLTALEGTPFPPAKYQNILQYLIRFIVLDPTRSKKIFLYYLSYFSGKWTKINYRLEL